MKKVNLYKIIIVMILFVSNLCFGEETPAQLVFLNEAQKADFLKTNEVLVQLGFEDFSGQIENTLRTGQNISDISKAALKRNAEYLQTFNASRKLANLTYVILNSAKTKEIFQRQLNLVQEILIQQLSPFPLLTLEPLSDELVKKIKHMSIEAGMDLKRDVIKVRAQERFYQEKLALIKAYVSLLKPSADQRKRVISWLDETITQAIIDAYTLEKRQQNRILGRAIVVAVVHLLREKQMFNAESDLKSVLRKQNLFLENYVSGYYVHLTQQNDIRGTHLLSGDLALEYSHGQEAFFTSLLIQPKSQYDKKNAKLNKLMNSIFDSYKFLDDKKYYEILDKKDTYKVLTPKEQSIYNDFWNPKYANGFSHVGIVQVKTETKTNISVAWIWDIYPEKDKLGVVRILSPEGFSYPEKMLKIGFLRYNREKLLESFKAQYAKNGFLKKIWEGYSSFYGQYADGNWGPSIDKEEFYTWPAKADPNQIASWMNIKPDEAISWYNEQLMPRVFARIKDYLISAEAKVFADGLVSAKDMLYCSQLVTMAYLEAANFDLQNTKDGIWESLKYLSNSIDKTLKVNIKHRLVSPNGLVWQQDIFQNLYTVFLNRNQVHNQNAKIRPTVAEQYTNRLNINDSEVIDETELLELNKDSIELDFES